jgi:hypothetical protein
LFELIGCTKNEQLRARIDPNQIVSVVVYDIHPQAWDGEGLAPRVPSVGELDKFNHAEFDTVLFKSLIGQAKYKMDVLWKGGSLAVINFRDGHRLMVEISYYGSFFRFLDTGDTYVFHGAAARLWYSEYNERILNQIFLPARSGTKWNPSEANEPIKH